MNKLMIGAAMGMMAGIGLMMSPMGKGIRKDVNRGMVKARRFARMMENMK